MNKAIDRVRRQLAYRPFRQFWLETIGGTRIKVERAESFYEVPNGPLYISDSDGYVTITWWSDLTDTVQVEGPANHDD